MSSHPTNLEKFGFKVYALLAHDFNQTFFVGGMVRDMLLEKEIRDIDLTTSAEPSMVEKLLKRHNITIDTDHEKFGVIRARQGTQYIEIATFRKDLPGPDRYSKVRFVKTAKSDSQRRDFTVNALYYNPKTGVTHDFHNGLIDLKKRQLKFIGKPEKRIKEDPLRIMRALRLQLQLNFSLEKKTETAIRNNFNLINNLSHAKIAQEVSKLQTKTKQKQLWKTINTTLDA